MLITLSLTLCVILLVYLIAVNNFYKKLKAYNFKGVTGIIFYFFCFVLGGLVCLLNTQSLKEEYHANRSFDYLKVWVNDEPQQTNDIVRFEVVVTTGYKFNRPETLSGKLLIALKVDSLNPVKLKYGDELIVSSKNLPVEPSYNPSEFDFKAWLATKNIYHQTFINQNHLVKLNSNKSNPIIKYAIEVRKRQVEIYRKLIHNDEAFAVASTLVLGYRADLSKETLAAYSKTGTIHALSVSGMHVGIIYIFLNWALFFLDKKRLLKIFKLLLISFLIWYYSLLTGFSPSVLRSAIMLTVYILAKAFNKNSNSYNILAFTAFCLLLYNPFLIWDVGFQLSFLAVFGLIYLQPKIYKWFYIKNKWLDKLWATVALSLAAQIATFPLSIYYFHQFPLYFIFSNLFILLPLTAMMYLGIGILMLRLYFLAPIFEWIINFTNSGLKWIANLPFSGITSIWLNQWQLILLSFTLIIFTIALVNYKKKLLIVSLLCILVFQSFAAYYKISASKQQKILFFSLRKNYAAAFIEGNEAVLLTDLDGSNKNYDFFVKPALDQMQITNIHFVKWEQDTALKSFIKKEHQLVFHQYHILLLDDDFNYKKIDQLPKFESVWLHQNPRKNVLDLRNEVLFSTLLVDATNKDYMIKRYEQDANKFQLQSHILKKNNSYLIDLKVFK
ncbi:ComEC family competence protein [Pedobacter boryungensis]|uniref:ComEC family competence protein n=1 Tax=Pedobacter boryungensis TaxID=869962 RepID=A0ABX2D9J7_9SPHI|nr:ComEC family competence protein [Pedobacter boryungensis]